ncbi:MAG: sensor histidine kinase [Sulfitobacter sp.]
MIAAMPLPCLAIDRAERIVALNDPARRLLGRQIEGRHYITVLRQPALVEAVENCMADRKPRRARYLSSEGQQETTYDVHLAHVPSRNLVLLSFSDASQAEQAVQMRRDFVANVSHELRTPLTALMGFIETLRGPARDDVAARERFLKIMSGEAERMNRLVGDLLSLSKVEEEARMRPRDVVDLQDILRATLRNLSPIAVEAEIRLMPVMPSGPILIRGDSDQLIQVFTNLVENAIKYGGSGKAVKVYVQTHLDDGALRGPSVRAQVIDEGPGIAAVHLPRLTERFYRADNHRSRDLGGTGLGLAIVKHIVNRHRGRLKITSKPGEGATFTVILPMDEGEQ